MRWRLGYSSVTVRSAEQTSTAGRDTGRGLSAPQQRRAAYRVPVSLPVWFDQPVECDCQLVDLSVNGARFDAELPCDPGSASEFMLVTESYGTIPIAGEVVRVGKGETAVRFLRLAHDAARVVTEIVALEQRRRLKLRVKVI